MDRQVSIGTFTPADTRASHAGLLSRWRHRRELRAARRAADKELLASGESRRTAWRAAELITPKNRLATAHSIHRLIRSADNRYLPGATPLNRLAVREHTAQFEALAGRLEDLDRPISPRGLLMLNELLADEYGPLYVTYRATELRATLARIEGGLQASS